MMARYNQRELLRSLQQYRYKLEELIDSIEQEDWISRATAKVNPASTISIYSPVIDSSSTQILTHSCWSQLSFFNKKYRL